MPRSRITLAPPGMQRTCQIVENSDPMRLSRSRCWAASRGGHIDASRCGLVAHPGISMVHRTAQPSQVQALPVTGQSAMPYRLHGCLRRGAAVRLMVWVHRPSATVARRRQQRGRLRYLTDFLCGSGVAIGLRNSDTRSHRPPRPWSRHVPRRCTSVPSVKLTIHRCRDLPTLRGHSAATVVLTPCLSAGLGASFGNSSHLRTCSSSSTGFNVHGSTHPIKKSNRAML